MFRNVLYLAALIPMLGSAALSVTVAGTSATQAVLRLTGWTGVCTMDVHENNAAGTQHPDWPALADSAHPLTTTNSTNEKFLVIGQRRANLALAAGQAYHYSITGCGTASGTFTTRVAILGAISHKQPPQNLNNWAKIDYPEVDLTPAGRNKWYVHPITGIKHRLVTQPEDFSWMDSINQPFVHPAGGVGWTNFGTIINGSTSTAQTTVTAPAYLYANIIGQATIVPWTGGGSSRTMENIGVVLWAQCVTGTGTDCDIELMLFDDPAVLPKAGTNILTVRAGGTFVQQTGTHPVTGTTASTISAATPTGTATYPGGTGGTTGFPRSGFGGWGTFTLTEDMYVRNTTTTATVSGGSTLAIAQATVVNHFPRGMKPGQQIFITGSSSNCNAWGVLDICTVATVTDPGNATIVETGVTAGSTAVRPLPWGVAVRKKTATGTVRIGAMYRAAGHWPYTTGTTQARCSQNTKTRTDGVVGRLCFIPHNGGLNHLYFISDDGEEIAPLDGMQQFGGDLPAMDFHPTDPASIYVWHPATGLYRMTHTGDFGVTNTVWETDPPTGARYAYKSGADYPDATWSDPKFTITLVLSAASIASQITTNYASQVTTPFPAWGSSNFLGVSGSMVGLYRLVESQDTGPCQVAMFNVLTGTLVDFINTGMAPNSPHNFTACHSLQFNPSIPNTILHSYNISGVKSAGATTQLLYGPHDIQIEAIKRGGTMNTNTCLEWPMTTGVNCAGLGGALPHYDKTCPTVPTIPQAWVDQGAAGNNCVTMRITGSTAAKAVCSEFGNAVGTSDDFAIFGACEWNAGATWSGGPTLEVGMKFVDRAYLSTGAPGDYGNFRVLTITPTGDGTTLTVVVQRNASREHCCGSNGTANPSVAAGVCAQADNQSQHADNWTGQMVPGWYGSCNSMTIYTTYPNPASNVGKYYTEVPRNLGAGHSTIGRISGDSYRYTSGDGSRELATFSELATQPPPAARTLNTTFNGLAAPIGGWYQQYLSQTQTDQSDLTNKYYTGDANHINGGGGTEQNAFAGGVADERPVFVKVAGFDSLWRLQVGGTNNIKLKPIIAWTGPFALSDISSPATGNLIDVAPMYSFCVAYKADQCRSGSVAGQAWVQSPGTYKHPTASIADDFQTGLEFANSPALLAATGPGGFVRRQRTDIPDETGSNQMLVSDFYKPAGTQYAFWNAVTTPGGGTMLAPSGGHFGLVRQVVWLAKVPKFPITNKRDAGYRPMTVTLGARTGVTHARAKFGNNPNFECNVHYKTACYTDSSLTPYAFSDDTLTPTACSSGCTLTMRVWGDEVLWYQVETSTDGTTFTPDPVQVLAP